MHSMLQFVQQGKLMDILISDLDWETFSESSSEDHEDVDNLFGGQARSIFSSLQESLGKIDDFLSFERLFVYGEVVCSAADQSGQMGRVTGINMFVDLESRLHGKVLKSINTKKLLKIRSISENDYVILGPWLGRVNKVVDKVRIVFDDGTKCEVNALELEKLVFINSDSLEDSQHPYYPGQRVRVKSPNSSKPTGWLCGTWKENQDEGTVCSVEAGLVYVNWRASALGSERSLPMPPCLQDLKKLTLLTCFSHANWQLGDWCVLQPISDCKSLMGQLALDSAIADNNKEQGSIGRGLTKGNFGSFDEVYVIVKTKTKVDVLWQDGTHSIELDSNILQPVSVVNAHEFWPMQFVVERGAFDDPSKSISHRWGVVQSMDAKERTVRLQWQSIPMSETKVLAGDRLEETVSAYELIEHPDYSYCYGDIVFKAAQKQLVYFGNQDHSKSVAGLNAEDTFNDKLCIDGGNDLADNCCLFCIGNVTGFIDGAVDVKWANGFTTKVAPHEIYKIDKNEDASSTSVPNEANANVLTQEMVEHEDSYQMKKGKGLSSFDCNEKVFQKHMQEASSFVLPRAATEFFSSMKTSIFRNLGLTSMSKSFSVLRDSDDDKEPEQLNEKGLSEASDLSVDSHEVSKLRSVNKTSSDEEGAQFQEQKDVSSPTNEDLSDRFKQFDIISDCSDHHFFYADKGFTFSQAKRGWMKKVQQEWSILEENLPETIYVRVYEERMDLLRAAIIGVPGTPYHDGVFFFDISFPPEYPYQPPMVHYYSGGLRVNPNLYESGKVCLSLLNTWTGSGTEVWNPSSSTILQVLLSLQALVLNDKPYFNEAGYDKQIGRVEGEKNSVSYNENAFLLTCKTMLYILKKPPKHFEALLQEHYKKRSHYILLACKSYLEGVPIGCASGCEKATSSGFKILLGKLFPKLVEAFSDNGMDCSQLRGP